MRTQKNNEWLWIIWLLILALLNAVALGAGRGGGRGGGDSNGGGSRSSSVSSSRSASAEPSQSARIETRSAQSRSSQPAPSSIPRTERSSISSAPQPSMTQQRASSAPARRSSQSISSQPERQVATRSRSVNREVIVAPSSQSLDVSPSRTVSRASASITAERSSGSSITAQTTSRAVEIQTPRTTQTSLNIAEKITVPKQQSRQTTVAAVRGGRAERNTDSSSVPVQPARQDRAVEKVQAQANDNRAETRQENASVSGRQPHSRIEPVKETPATEEVKSDITSSSSSDTAGRRERTQTSDRGKNEPVRVSSDQIKSEPVRVKTDDIKTDSVQSRDTQSADRQRRDGSERITRTTTKDRTDKITVMAAKTSDTDRMLKQDGSEITGPSSGGRWGKLRSEIDTRARADMESRSRGDRLNRDNRIQPDDKRSRVEVSGDRINVREGDRNDARRPHVSPHLVKDIGHINDNHRDSRRDDHYDGHSWKRHGSCFTFGLSWSCGQILLTPYYGWYGISYYYPHYHRKYVFVSLGGYWPYSYRYHRYYWYGCHPYYWYGAYVAPDPAPVVYDYYTTNNYYYYNTPAAASEAVAATAPAVPAENTTITDAPLPQTEADIRFANAVNAFEQGRYSEAASLFREAILLSPDDEVLPFTYSQALFASGDYALAAYVLRETMAKVSSEEPTVYFPRGLYKDDQTLIDQIGKLQSAIVTEPFSTDYQLLLGYQFLGLGRWDDAAVALEKASRNPLHADAVKKLLYIAEKMEKDTQQPVVAPQS